MADYQIDMIHIVISEGLKNVITYVDKSKNRTSVTISNKWD